MNSTRIVLPGGAGLVGQNLIARLKARGYTNLIVLDKQRANLEILKDIHPDVEAVYADLAEPGEWEHYFEHVEIVVMLQAQIGGPTIEPFIRNNIEATKLVLAAIKRYNVRYTVHISSSVLYSAVEDFYTETKREQENLVLSSEIECVVLRPTLMFGWFDRKHLGWLSRFMHRVPVFPIPGDGRYMRQPLYVGDFCNIIISCVETRIKGQAFNISGLESIDYIDIIRQIKRTTRAHCAIVRIPYGLFYALLKVYAVFDKNPPFTADQLKALTAGDEFEIIDWERIFQVKSTPFSAAMEETFNDPTYSQISLEF
jgi:nucleoside-diphosphate-sugar epimerase